MMKTKSIKTKVTSNITSPVQFGTKRPKGNNLNLGATIRWGEDGEANVNLLMLKLNCSKSEAVRYALRVCLATL
jgi:hypothetical protein